MLMLPRCGNLITLSLMNKSDLNFIKGYLLLSCHWCCASWMPKVSTSQKCFIKSFSSSFWSAKKGTGPIRSVNLHWCFSFWTADTWLTQWPLSSNWLAWFSSDVSFYQMKVNLVLTNLKMNHRISCWFRKSAYMYVRPTILVLQPIHCFVTSSY